MNNKKIGVWWQFAEKSYSRQVAETLRVSPGEYGLKSLHGRLDMYNQDLDDEGRSLHPGFTFASRSNRWTPSCL